MKLNRRSFYLLFLLSAVSATACSDAPTNNNAARTVSNNTAANAANVNATAPSPLASVTPANTTTAAGSPSATVAAYQQAMFKKDEAAFRKAISEASAREISAEATAEKKNLVQFWTELSPVKQPTVETRNERIAGETAFIETKNPETGLWSPSKLVRERGEWKMDLTAATAVELQELIKKQR